MRGFLRYFKLLRKVSAVWGALVSRVIQLSRIPVFVPARGVRGLLRFAGFAVVSGGQSMVAGGIAVLLQLLGIKLPAAAAR